MAESTQKCVLITGASGFVGQHLQRAIRQQRPHWRVYPFGSPDQESGLDVRDVRAVSDAFRNCQPDTIVHLAAVSSPVVAEQSPEETWLVNAVGSAIVARAARTHASGARLLFVSTPYVHGPHLASDGPIAEDAPIWPANTYAATKAAAELAMKQHATLGGDVVIARPFNHTGPGQTTDFVIPTFAAQIARIERGLQSPRLRVGALDDARDFLDVRDVVAAYILLIEHPELEPAATFNIASGVGRRIGDILETLLVASFVRISIEQDGALFRKASPKIICGDSTRLRALGWKPEVAWNDTLMSVLEDQRSAIPA